MIQLLVMFTRKFLGIMVVFLCLFILEGCLFRKNSTDRSGFVIFEIIPSEINQFQYGDDTFALDAIRKLKHFNTFKINLINKKTGATANLSSEDKFNILMDHFSSFKNVKKIKIDSYASVHFLAKIVIGDYSILEPAEFNFLIKDNEIFLERDKNEYYTVDIPMSEFQKLRQFCIDGIKSQRKE